MAEELLKIEHLTKRYGDDPVLDDLKTLQKEYTEVTNRLLEVEKELRFIKNKKGE